jgi:hypothetical protein
MLLVVPGHVCHADDPLHDDAADGVADVQRAVAVQFKKHEQFSLFQMVGQTIVIWDGAHSGFEV